ncbi:MAG: hypothetical protein IJL26_08555 [Clostridia bacterium]|nr:hypothetical protein [Clostridia bacterium]
MKKNIIKASAFLLAFVLSLSAIGGILSYKFNDSTHKISSFYHLPRKSLDVLVLGTSHAFMGVNTASLWKNYGVAAFSLCGPVLPMWNAYYYLVEALKTQSPKVVVLDLFSLTQDFEYQKEEFAIKNTYGLRFSLTKLQSIKASFDMKQKDAYVHYFGLLQTHSRYSELNSVDWLPYYADEAQYKNFTGFQYSLQTKADSEPDFSNVTGTQEPAKKQLQYFKKILELSAKKKIPVMLTMIPYPHANANQYKMMRYGSELAKKEYGIATYDYINTLKKSVGLDYSKDFGDDSHLNWKGTLKLAKAMGKTLTTKYNVADRRGAKKYENTWGQNASYIYNFFDNKKVPAITSADDYVDVVNTERYLTVITYTLRSGKKTPTSIRTFLRSLNIPKEQYMQGGVWILQGGAAQYYSNDRSDGYVKNIKLTKRILAHVETKPKKTEGKTENVYYIYYGGSAKMPSTYGLNIFVFDTFNQKVVDCVAVKGKDDTLYR